MARPASEIQSDLTAAYSARLAALKAQSSSLDTGQGRLSTAKANLTEINNTIGALEAELAAAQDTTGGIMHISLER
jgi:uncharacterized phage infection (PIP) family protein YhgE